MSAVTLSFNAVALLGTCAIDCRNFGLLNFRSVVKSAIAIARQTSTALQPYGIQKSMVVHGDNGCLLKRPVHVLHQKVDRARAICKHQITWWSAG
jgi:hypothetical protein